MRKPIPHDIRIRDSVEMSADGCWLWQKSANPGGYGRMWVGSKLDGTRRLALAHRVSYEFHVGPIPEGMHLDHLCRVPACCNPEHLEPVTPKENVHRGIIGPPRDLCDNGHVMAENAYVFPSGRRNCRACRTETRHAKLRAEVDA